MTAALEMLQAHVQAEAMRAARVADGDKARTLDNLLVMAARDHLLAEGLLRDAVQKAAADACKSLQTVAETGGGLHGLTSRLGLQGPRRAVYGADGTFSDCPAR